MSKSVRFICACLFVVVVFAALAACDAPRSKIDDFINNPFTFDILKNYSCDFTSIGPVLENKSICPLEKENIADPSFCYVRVVSYEGLTVRIFSFDVLQSGTAEYLVTSESVRLKNGLAIGSTKKDVNSRLGRPYKVAGDLYIWRSGDLHNYLVFTIVEDTVIGIRWHEEREPVFKNTVVWNTKY